MAKPTENISVPKKRNKPVRVSFVVKLIGAVIAVNVVCASVLLVMVLNGAGADSTISSVNENDPNRAAEVLSSAVDDEKTARMINTVDTDFIYENIFIGGIDVGGLTKEDAFLLLTEKLQKPIDNIKIDYIKDDDVNEYTFKDFAANYNLQEVVTQAYNYARTGTTEARYAEIQALKTNHLEIMPEISYDKEKTAQIIKEISDKYDVSAVNATISRYNGQFVFTDEAWGLTTDPTELTVKTDLLLSNRVGGEIIVTLAPAAPKYTVESLKQATSKLGTYTTYFSKGTNNRNTNIEVASESVNNAVIMPGEILSVGDAFGPSTEAKGYKLAGSYLAGEVVQSVGGGMCQVSSTLYAAVLNAEIEVAERRNHSMSVSYIPKGMDATLSEGSIDFKIKNNTDLPIVIESIASSSAGYVTVNIYGHETRDPQRTIEFKPLLIETYNPGPEVVTEDPTLPSGERVVTTNAGVGGKYQLWKIIYYNGVENNRELVNTSRYNPIVGRVKVGTANPTPTPAPTKNSEQVEGITTTEPPVKSVTATELPVESVATEVPSIEIGEQIPVPEDTEQTPVPEDAEQIPTPEDAE
ncbi:MAG: VanW family protein [Clostridiales bacterium]|jgi:vancomycin resistance protein YoaR|nr:VanW family protein [Clostridiales bacterium]